MPQPWLVVAAGMNVFPSRPPYPQPTCTPPPVLRHGCRLPSAAQARTPLARRSAATPGLVFVTGGGGRDCLPFATGNCDVLVQAYEQRTGMSLWNRQIDLSTDDSGLFVRTAGAHVPVAGTVSANGVGHDGIVQSG